MLRASYSMPLWQSASLRWTGAALAIAVAIAPASVAAQSVQMEEEPSAGSMIVLREVPTRPAQKQRNGDALTVTLAPNDAFADALDLGIEELDDAQAALITSTALNGLAQLAQVAVGTANAETLIADSLQSNGLSFLTGSTNAGVGSVINGSIDSSLAATNSAIDSAVGSISTALGGLNGGGQ